MTNTGRQEIPELLGTRIAPPAIVNLSVTNRAVAGFTSRLKKLHQQICRRCRQTLGVWKAEGNHGVANRIRRAAADWMAPQTTVLPVRRSDVIAADLSRPFHAATLDLSPGQPIVANWVMTPPAPGSGGHTTIFRLIRYLEAHGYQNCVYFYDVYRGDHAYYTSVVRDYYGFHGCVANVDAGMRDAHVVIATGWPTAYPVFNARCAGKRFYFVQDFEPYFYPVGTLSLLAESTYRMGFHGISIGKCYADKLTAEFGMTVDSFRYGCDISRYRPLSNSRRNGVVFYARRETARRGVELGLMALELFAARRPDVPIHIYGDAFPRLPFAFTNHGQVTPEQINGIYNRCCAGLSLSFTNVSLVALEMLAAGCIPVVNDTVEVRTDMNNPFVRYTAPYPEALASALESVVTDSKFDLLSQGAVASVKGTSWDEAGAAVDSIFRHSIAPT